MKKEAQ